jgi:hypothetical protein
MFKIIIIAFVLCTFSFSSYEEVRIGSIDRYYKNKISKEELIVMLEEIEQQFESQLGFNVFDYANSGKPIDIIYVPPLQLETRITRKLQLLKQKKVKLDNAKKDFSQEQNIITRKQRTLNNKTKKINKEITSLNNYISNANKTKNYSKNEYSKIKKYVQDKQKYINAKRTELKREKILFQKEFNKYNRKVFSYNNLIREHNRLSKEIIRLSRSVRKVKGRTFGYQEVSLKTYYKDGRKIKKKSVQNSMNKIEIYGFDSKNQLKAVLAHEIGHLVGIPHINAKNSLMHPILQENQINALYLIPSDIRNFKKNF